MQVEVRGLPDAGKALLEIHLVAHALDDAVDDEWPDSVHDLASGNNNDLGITLMANDALGEWQKIMTEILKYSPVRWRSHQLYQDQLNKW